jgi:hypothetical protein
MALTASPRLTDPEAATLSCVVGLMIPCSAEFDLPGADDALIFRDILGSLGRDAIAVRTALQLIESLAEGQLLALPRLRQHEVLERFRQAEPDLAWALVAVTAASYYRDDRIMASLGMSPRPPYPTGFEVPSGNLSLLDPVRARGPA